MSYISCLLFFISTKLHISSCLSPCRAKFSRKKRKGQRQRISSSTCPRVVQGMIPLWPDDGFFCLVTKERWKLGTSLKCCSCSYFPSLHNSTSVVAQRRSISSWSIGNYMRPQNCARPVDWCIHVYAVIIFMRLHVHSHRQCSVRLIAWIFGVQGECWLDPKMQRTGTGHDEDQDTF